MGQLYSYTAMTVVMNCSPLILTGAEGLSASQGLSSLETLLEANGGRGGDKQDCCGLQLFHSATDLVPLFLFPEYFKIFICS